MVEKFPLVITKSYSHSFPIAESGLYASHLTASCRSGRQIGQPGGEDLRVEIDGLALREIPPVARTQNFNIPPAWNGTQLQGLSKTVIILINLMQGNHVLNFIPYRGATIESEPVIKKIEHPEAVNLVTETQAPEGDRRPWITIALIDLPLQSLSLEATAKGRFRDSDDLKLIIDGQIKPNPSPLAILRRDWLLSGSLLKKLFQTERQTFTFEENLSAGTHYLEIWADRTPTIHQYNINPGQIVQPVDEEPKLTEEPQRKPTVDDPAWTGDFADDTEQIILTRAIFGEARDALLSDEVRIGIGWSIRHRVEDQRWGDNYHDVITQSEQYSAFNKNDEDNRPYVENPFWNNQEIDRIMWKHCFERAGQVIAGTIPDPTNGANHYYDISIDPPYWAIDEKFLLQIDTVRFYLL